MPLDAFHVEYFGQGELAKVAENPLKNPQLFQEFLDRHTTLRDLVETEETLVTMLRENAGRLNPLENAFGQLTGKKKTLEEIEKKLKVAEDGNLREVVGTQSKLASEKAVREAIDLIVTQYNNGYKFANIQRNFDQLIETAGTCTDDAECQKTLESMKSAITTTNAFIKLKEGEVNAAIKICAQQLQKLSGELKVHHQRIGGGIATKLADLKARGLASDIPGLEALLRRKTQLAAEIAAVEQRTGERKECREERAKLRERLKTVREEMTTRRKRNAKASTPISLR